MIHETPSDRVQQARWFAFVVLIVTVYRLGLMIGTSDWTNDMRDGMVEAWDEGHRYGYRAGRDEKARQVGEALVRAGVVERSTFGVKAAGS